MVKGVSRRVIVVRPERGGMFEQAIFIVKGSGHSPNEVLREACRIAADCAPGSKRRPRLRAFLRRAAYFAAGGATVGAAWVICALM